jgi:hypothetical protein
MSAGVTHWYSTCLACVNLSIQFQQGKRNECFFKCSVVFYMYSLVYEIGIKPEKVTALIYVNNVVCCTFAILSKNQFLKGWI